MEGLRLPSPTLPRRRERRLLGDDFPAKLMAAGFQIRIRTTTSRPAPAASIMGAMGARCRRGAMVRAMFSGPRLLID